MIKTISKLAIPAAFLGSAICYGAHVKIPEKYLHLKVALKGGDPDFTTSESFEAAFDELEKSPARNLASTKAADDSLMSPAYKKFRDEFLAIDDPKVFDEKLAGLEENYATLPTDLKFVAAQLIPMRAFKSFIWRMVPVVRQSRMTQEVLLIQVREYAEKMMTYYPDSQWKAGFRYMAEAFGDLEQFHSEAEAQQFFASQIYPAMKIAASRIKALRIDPAHPVIWDNKMRFGDGTFPDSLDRYRVIGEAERYATLARMHKRMFWLAMNSAYNVDHYLDLKSEVGKRVGIDSVNLAQEIQGLTRKERVDVINGERYKGLFVLHEDGVATLQVAYKHLHQFVGYTRNAWAILKKEPDSDYDLLDAEMFRARRREGDLAIKNMWAIVNQRDANTPVELKSSLTGDTFKVNMLAFFAAPPKDMKDLLPNQFEGGDEYNTKLGEKYKFRNYYRGRAIGWRVEAYKKLFPDVKNPADVGNVMRTLSDTRGGKIVLLTLTPFVR